MLQAFLRKTGRRLVKAGTSLRRPFLLRKLSTASKVIVGASGTTMPGWTATEREILDLCDIRTFSRIWSGPQITHFLAEHVWEHLDAVCAEEAIRNCSKFMLPGGRLRIAVPDGNHPDSAYIENVRPGGSGPGCDDHKHLFTVSSLSDLIRKGGLEPEPLEWWDDQGNFHKKPWDPRDGMIVRSADYDERNLEKQLSYTSLIIDSCKGAEQP